MVFGSELHTGQTGGIPIPFSLSVAFTAMLKWHHCHKKCLIFGRDNIFHTHVLEKGVMLKSLAFLFANWYASLNLNSLFEERCQVSLSSSWQEKEKGVAFISKRIGVWKEKETCSKFQPIKPTTSLSFKFSSSLFSGPEIRLRRFPLSIHLSYQRDKPLSLPGIHLVHLLKIYFPFLRATHVEEHEEDLSWVLNTHLCLRYLLERTLT